ncbi:MAG: UPF0758 domain-containing protein [Chloroflexota bacterium]
MCDLPVEERPLYRLHQHGSDALATSELLALLLGTAEAPGLAAELLTTFGNLHQLARANKARLLQIRGIERRRQGGCWPSWNLRAVACKYRRWTNGRVSAARRRRRNSCVHAWGI